MRFTQISDVHVDKHPLDPATFCVESDRNIPICISGDISNSPQITMNWLIELRKHRDIVIWVPGNHDFYNSISQKLCDIDSSTILPYPSTVPDIHNYYRTMSNKHDIICLNRDTVLINGVRFIGAVGWHNFVAGEPYSMKMQIDAWSNNSNEPYIRWDNKGTNCNPNLVLNESQLDFEYIRDTVARYPNDKIVVMTHHLPHRSLSWFKPHDPIWTQLHGMFVNTMMELITNSNITYWVFGHTHSRMMREINGILYVANPRGYPHETNNWEPIDLDV